MNKMITVCFICLRSDRKLSSLDFCLELENFYDELCEYGARITVQEFCYECIYKLKKCYEFKKSCQLAAATLKTWRKQPKAVKKPITHLYKEMPVQLSLCNKKNYRVYFYQTTDVNLPTSIQMCSSNHPHIVTVNIPRDNNIGGLNCEIKYINEHNDKALNTLLVINDDVKTEVMDVADNANQTKIEDVDIIFDFENKHDTEPILENLQNEDEELGSANDNISDFENEILFDGSMYKTESDSDESIKKLEKPKKSLLEMAEININDTDSKSTMIFSDSYETKKPKRKRKKRIIEDSVSEHNIVSDINETMKPIRKRKKKVIEDSESDEAVSVINKIMKPSRKRKKSIDFKLLKAKLKEKFELYGPIKDTNAKIIDPDVILNNLDKIPWTEMLMKKICAGSGPLPKYFIYKFAALQDDITLYDSVFDTLLIKDPEQVKAQFEKRRQNGCHIKHEHRCESCITSFPHRWMLTFHMKKSHDPEAPFECTLCHMRFRGSNYFRTHKRTHQIEYKCKLCYFVTGSRENMIAHYNKHKGILYNCKYCEKSFKMRGLLFNHIRIHQDPKHICQLCASAFNTQAGLRIHNKQKHNYKNEKFVESEHNMKCEKCNVIFISEQIYNRHLKISCQIKPPSYYNKRNETHIKNTEKGGDFLCDICGIQLRHRQLIETHTLKHSGSRPFACSKCPQSFYNKIGLLSHMLWHSPPTYECIFCKKKFHTNTGLSRHVKAHINDRKYVCDICGKGFVFPESLKEHVTGVHQHKRRIKKPRPKNTQ